MSLLLALSPSDCFCPQVPVGARQPGLQGGAGAGGLQEEQAAAHSYPVGSLSLTSRLCMLSLSLSLSLLSCSSGLYTTLLCSFVCRFALSPSLPLSLTSFSLVSVVNVVRTWVNSLFHDFQGEQGTLLSRLLMLHPPFHPLCCLPCLLAKREREREREREASLRDIQLREEQDGRERAIPVRMKRRGTEAQNSSLTPR